MKIKESSRAVLAGVFVGVNRNFSITVTSAGTKKTGVTIKMRLTAVCYTAAVAQATDLPKGLCVSLSRTSMPVLISVCLIMYALRKPADDIARKDVAAFSHVSLAPLAFFNAFADNFLRPNPTVMALDAATA